MAGLLEGPQAARVKGAPQEPRAAVEAVLGADRICWFPVRHFSVACAWHLQQVIEALQPDAVLIEAPDDATALIPALVAEDTVPPVSILSTWVDQKNQHGLAGVLSSSPETPVRFRGWWPLVEYSPEYVALRAGHAVGAELAFIDAPLPATVPFNQARRGEAAAVVRDRHLQESAYFEALRRRGRRRDFTEFWDATFEVKGLASDTLAFMRSVLLFAWCTRNLGGTAGLELDGTELREAHMRWHVDQARKKHDGWIVVVTGAFHSVALPWVKGKRSKVKADRYTSTLLCAHSYPALARLYGQNRQPGYGGAVWGALQEGAERPHDAAVSALLVEVMRAARAEGQPVSTADAVGAWRVAGNLAQLRGNDQPTRYDLLDAAQMAYVKGEASGAGLLLEPVARRILVGAEVGTVSALAGEVPLLGGFYQAAKAHRIDVTGEHKVVRCDLGKQIKHRQKSAFLHRADFLELPMFASVDKKRRRDVHFRGPDPVAGTDLHLITETWGIRWTEGVDACLIELADRGNTLGEVATSVLREQLQACEGDSGEAGALVLATARMLLLPLLDEALGTLRAALSVDTRFSNLTRAITNLQLLYELRQGMATQGVESVLDALEATWTAAVLQLPQQAGVEAEHQRQVVDGLQDLVRLAVGFDPRGLDVELLVDRLEALCAVRDGNPLLRGAATGVLHGLGHRTELQIAEELSAIARGSGAQEAGAFLEGLLVAGKGVLLGGRRLLDAVDTVIQELDWQTFRRLLPDLRRAFTQFIPSELDVLGARVAVLAGLGTREDLETPVPDGLRAVVFQADRSATDALEAWRGSLP